MTVPAPAALPSLTTLLKLREWGAKWVHFTPQEELSDADLRGILDCAIAIRRLEEWLNADIERHANVNACAIGLWDGTSEFPVGRADLPPGTLLAALVRALAQTTEKTP